jgi:hypothetical protein
MESSFVLIWIKIQELSFANCVCKLVSQCDDIAGSQSLTQSIGYLQQQRIALCMAQGIVDDLEKIALNMDQFGGSGSN